MPLTLNELNTHLFKAADILRDSNVAKIVSAFDGFENIEKFCAVVGKESIIENDYNLNVSLYVDTSEAEPEIDVAAVNEELKELIRQRDESYREMQAYLKDLGYPNCDSGACGPFRSAQED